MLAGALELFFVSPGLAYYVATVDAGLPVIRRARKARRLQAAAGVRGPGGRRSGGRGSGPAADLAASVSVGWGRLRTRLETGREPTRDAWADDREADGGWPSGTWAGDVADGGGGLVRDQPARRPSSRSGHGQSRRVAGSHRAAGARPAQHSGR